MHRAFLPRGALGAPQHHRAHDRPHRHRGGAVFPRHQCAGGEPTHRQQHPRHRRLPSPYPPDPRPGFPSLSAGR